MRWSHHVLLLAMFVHREMENLDPNSLDHALYSGRAQNSIKPEYKESLYNHKGGLNGSVMRGKGRGVVGEG